MMTVLKVTFSPQLESEKLIPNKNTQENSGKKKSTLNKRYEQFVQKGKKKNKQTENVPYVSKQLLNLAYINRKLNYNCFKIQMLTYLTGKTQNV